MEFPGMNKLKNRDYMAALKIFSRNTIWVLCYTDVEYESAGAYLR